MTSMSVPGRSLTYRHRFIEPTEIDSGSRPRASAARCAELCVSKRPILVTSDSCVLLSCLPVAPPEIETPQHRWGGRNPSALWPLPTLGLLQVGQHVALLGRLAHGPPVSLGEPPDCQVKSSGVVCDGFRVIFLLGQALSAGMVTSSFAVESVPGTGRMRQRVSTSRPR